MSKFANIDGIGPVHVVITTANYRAGQSAAEKMHATDPDSTPIDELISRRGAEFASGFRARWADLTVLARDA